MNDSWYIFDDCGGKSNFVPRQSISLKDFYKKQNVVAHRFFARDYHEILLVNNRWFNNYSIIKLPCCSHRMWNFIRETINRRVSCPWRTRIREFHLHNHLSLVSSSIMRHSNFIIASPGIFSTVNRVSVCSMWNQMYFVSLPQY